MYIPGRHQDPDARFAQLLSAGPMPKSIQKAYNAFRPLQIQQREQLQQDETQIPSSVNASEQPDEGEQFQPVEEQAIVPILKETEDVAQTEQPSKPKGKKTIQPKKNRRVSMRTIKQQNDGDTDPMNEDADEKIAKPISGDYFEPKHQDETPIAVVPEVLDESEKRPSTRRKTKDVENPSSSTPRSRTKKRKSTEDSQVQKPRRKASIKTKGSAASSQAVDPKTPEKQEDTNIPADSSLCRQSSRRQSGPRDYWVLGSKPKKPVYNESALSNSRKHKTKKLKAESSLDGNVQSEDNRQTEDQVEVQSSVDTKAQEKPKPEKPKSTVLPEYEFSDVEE